MAACRECLEQIVWVDRSDGGGRVPCEYVDTRGTGLYVLQPGSLKIAMPSPPIVVRHSCNPTNPFPFELVTTGGEDPDANR